MDELPVLQTLRDVDAYYFLSGIAAVRALLEPQTELDAWATVLVHEWLARYDEPLHLVNQPPAALAESFDRPRG